MIKFNILSSCLLTLCLSVNVSYAAPEGGVVTDGPLTSLDKLDTISAGAGRQALGRPRAWPAGRAARSSPAHPHCAASGRSW